MFLSFLRPILDYGSFVWYFGFSKESPDKVEVVKIWCPWIILNDGKISCFCILREASLITLKGRRTSISLRFYDTAFNYPGQLHFSQVNSPPSSPSLLYFNEILINNTSHRRNTWACLSYVVYMFKKWVYPSRLF